MRYATGACWITDQMELQLGTQARYLVDFYHLCDYLSDAADAVADSEKQGWMQEKKTLLKQNRWREVFKDLEPFLEPVDTADDDAPVRACHRPLYRQSIQLPGLSRSPREGFAHWFGRDRERPWLHPAESAQNRRSVVDTE